MPSSWGMFVYREETSKVPMIAVLGIWFLMSSSLRRKSGVSCIYDEICGTRGLRKLSMNNDMCSVGDPLPETMGLPGLPALVNLGEQVKPGSPTINGGEEFVNFLGQLVT